MEFISDLQRNIVLSTTQYKLINGCAGSHKTDTLIKCAISTSNVLFLTKVSSVTLETKERLEKYLGKPFPKRSGNHYYGELPICISTFDAWVANMITRTTIVVGGHEYDRKIELLQNYEHQIMMRSAQGFVSLLIIDEVQDLNDAKMNLILRVARDNPELKIYVAGDYLQTLRSNVQIHAMNMFKVLEPVWFDLNICYRCPPAHVAFNNIIMRAAQQKYSIPPMLCNSAVNSMPVIFTHRGTSENGDALHNAEQISGMIFRLLEIDPDIKPDDIVVLMASVNNNLVFEHLAVKLNPLAYHMTTKSGDKHTPIDWHKAAGKIKLMSIDADKGKGHKVVFFIGFTDGSIPQKHEVGTCELRAESLLNVAITRSTEYLFIGVNRIYPSRYLTDESITAAYRAWEPLPLPFSYVVDGGGAPFRNIKYPPGVVMGFPSLLNVSHHITEFESAHELCGIDVAPEEITFGRIQHITAPDYTIIGHMAEIMLRPREEFRRITKNMCYTDNERILCYMYDCRVFGRSNTILTRAELEFVRNAYNCVHSTFKNLDLSLFFTEKKLPSTYLWNFTLFYLQASHRLYRPSLNLLYDGFHENIDILRSNIETYRQMVSPNARFEVPTDCIREKHGIAGICDIIDDNTIIEIKASNKSGCQPEWIVQTIAYSALIGHRSVCVVNLLRGTLYDIELPQVPIIDIISRFEKKFNWQESEIALFT